MNLGIFNQATSKAVRRALILSVIGALFTGFMTVNTVTSTNLGNGTVKLATETFSDDAAEEYRPEHGFLTRRAEIVLDDPGACRVQ